MSFIESYQEIKSLMVEKLNEKGVDADASEGFTTLIDKIDSIGSIDSYTYNIIINIVWNDDNNSNLTRPTDEIKVYLSSNGSLLNAKEIGQTNNWAATLSTPELDNISIDSDDVPYYTKQITRNNNTFTITYTLQKGRLLLSASVLNEIEDFDVNDLSFTVNGPDTSFPKIISYEVCENGLYDFGAVLPGYYVVTVNNYPLINGANSKVVDTKRVEPNSQAELSVSFAFIDTSQPPVLDFPVSIIWNDNDNVDENRPNSVVINLLKNNVQIDSVTLSDSNYWGHTFEELDMYDENNELISYSITQTMTSNWYIGQINGGNVINTYTRPTTFRQLMIEWYDNNDAVGNRPQSITATLLPTQEQYIITAEDEWVIQVNDLPEYLNQEEVEYSWVGIDVVGYVMKDVEEPLPKTTLIKMQYWG